MKNCITALCRIGIVVAFVDVAASACVGVSPSVQGKNDERTVSYTLTYQAPVVRRQLFLDIDEMSTRGYTITGIGADFLVENGILYAFAGSRANDWAWSLIGKVSYVDDGSRTQWTIARSLLEAEGSRSSKYRVFASVTYLSRKSGSAPVLVQSMKLAKPLLRDPLRWPFASTSIWNMPIGDKARYVPANLPPVPQKDEGAPVPNADRERIILTPDVDGVSVLHTELYLNTAGWQPGQDRCQPLKTLLATVPMPIDFVVSGSRYNNGAAFLLEDHRTILQLQPLARCKANEPATSLLTFDPVDLYGPGITGAHGGSRLSTLGGVLRVGELADRQMQELPGHTIEGPRHALKLNVDTREALHECTTMTDCWTWPAQAADSDAPETYGTLRRPSGLGPAPQSMKMGALLAIPPDLTAPLLGLQTFPAKQLLWTLQNYGAYIVDSTGGSGYDFSVEEGPGGSFLEQFEAAWGFDFIQRVRGNSAWTHDVQALIGVLHVVDDNSPATIGGAGNRLQRMAPPLP